MVTETIGTAGTFTDQLVLVFAEDVVVGVHEADSTHAFDGVRELDIDAVVRDAGDDAVELLIDVVTHPLAFLQLIGLALRFVSAALEGGRAVGDGREQVLIVLEAALVELTAEVLLDDPVDLEVRIASDRGGEVTVVLRREAEVTGALGGVAGLLEGAERHRLDDRLLRGADDGIEELLHLLRADALVIADTDEVAEVLDGEAELLELLGIRLLVYTEDERNLLPEEVLGDGFIGREHEVLDQHMGFVSLVWVNVGDMALCIEDDLRLREVEVDAATLVAALPEELRQLVHALEQWLIRQVGCDVLAVRELRVREDRVHAAVAHALVGADDRLTDFVVQNLTARVDVHDAGEGQAILLRVQGADAVAEHTWQHRDHAVREVDGGAAVQGFLIDQRVLLHIFRDIRDVDIESVLLRRLVVLEGNGVVEVLRVLAVDGDGGELTEVVLPAARDGVLRYGLRDRLGSAHDVLRKGFREPVGPDDGEDVDARIIDMAENLGDDTLRTVLLIPVVHDFHNDLMAVYGVHILPLRDVDVLQDPLVVRLDEADGFILMIEADDFLIGMLEDLGDVSLGAMVRVCTSCNDDAHAITVERLTDIIGRDKDVRLIFVALHRHEAEAAWMCMEGADMCEIFCAAILSLLGDADAALRYETVQHLLEGGTLRLRNTDQHGHFLRFHRLIDRILHEIHDQLREFFLLIILHKFLFYFVQSVDMFVFRFRKKAPFSVFFPLFGTVKKSTCIQNVCRYIVSNLIRHYQITSRTSATRKKSTAAIFVNFSSPPSMERPLFLPQ